MLNILLLVSLFFVSGIAVVVAGELGKNGVPLIVTK